MSMQHFSFYISTCQCNILNSTFLHVNATFWIPHLYMSMQHFEELHWYAQQRASVHLKLEAFWPTLALCTANCISLHCTAFCYIALSYIALHCRADKCRAWPVSALCRRRLQRRTPGGRIKWGLLHPELIFVTVFTPNRRCTTPKADICHSFHTK